jgi:type IV secretory pathway VirB2 component (pilin)
MERRVPFFLIAALVCGVLTFAAPADFRWVPVVVAAVYLVLAAATALEQWTEGRRRREPGP